MTVLTDFTPANQAVLSRTPTAVAMAAAFAEHDGPVTLARELRAGLTAAREAAFAFPDNEIIQALASAMHEVDDAETKRREDGEKPGGDGEDGDGIVEERNPSLALETSLELAAMSLAIMEANASLEETVQFKHWLYAIAEQVTLATKSGGVLGIGGDQISEGERDYLDNLRATLDIEE